MLANFAQNFRFQLRGPAEGQDDLPVPPSLHAHELQGGVAGREQRLRFGNLREIW